MSPIQSMTVKQTPLVEKPNHHSRSGWYFRKRLSAFSLLLNIYHKGKHGCIESTMNPILTVKQTPSVEKSNHHLRSGWYFRKRLSAFSLLLNIYHKRKHGRIESTMSPIQSMTVKQTPLVEKPNHHSRSGWYFRKRLSTFSLLLNIYHKGKHGCIESTMSPIQSMTVKQTPLVEKPNHHSRSGWYFRKRLSAFSLLLNIYHKGKHGCIESTMSSIQSITVKQIPFVEKPNHHSRSGWYFRNVYPPSDFS